MNLNSNKAKECLENWYKKTGCSTYREFADAINVYGGEVGLSGVDNWMHSRCGISQKNLSAMSKIFGVDESVLIDDPITSLFEIEASSPKKEITLKPKVKTNSNQVLACQVSKKVISEIDRISSLIGTNRSELCRRIIAKFIDDYIEAERNHDFATKYCQSYFDRKD